MNNQFFENESISTCAAILASSDKVSLHGVKPSGRSSKTAILLEPKAEAELLYRELLNEKLMINASRNLVWVEKLKSLVFGNGL